MDLGKAHCFSEGMFTNALGERLLEAAQLHAWIEHLGDFRSVPPSTS